MRFKLIAILVLGALVIAGATAIGIANVKNLDRTFFLAENVQNEASLVKQSASLLTQKYADNLSRLASELKGLSRGSTAAKDILGASDFFMVATLEEGGGKKWGVGSSFRKGTQNIGWTVEEEPKMLKALPIAAVNFKKSLWYRHLSKSGHPLYVLIVKAKVSKPAQSISDSGANLTDSDQSDVILVGVLSNQAFASAIQSFKGTDREVIVLDDRGYALGYTRQQYLGAPIKHPLVEKLKAERKLFDFGEFKNAQERNVVGAYARLEDSNLYAVVTRPIEGLPSLVSATFMQLASFTFAGLAFCFLLVFIVFRSQIASFEYLQDFVISMAQGLPVRAPENYSNISGILMESVEKLRSEGVPEIRVAEEAPEENEGLVEDQQTDAVSSNDRMSSGDSEHYQTAVKGLVQSFKQPLGSILGQTQLARSKANDEELKEHYEVIEREARKIRETLEQLVDTSLDEEELILRPVTVSEILLASLNELRSDIERVGVKVRKDLSSPLEINADFRQMKQAIKEVLLNAVEAVSASEAKDLYVAIRDHGSSVSILIQDSGPGIGEEDLQRVFEPFYSRKSDEAHKGMGLSVAKSLFERHHGAISVESNLGKGTKFSITLPLRSAPQQQPVVEVDGENQAEPQQWETLSGASVAGASMSGEGSIEEQSMAEGNKDPDHDLVSGEDDDGSRATDEVVSQAQFEEVDTQNFMEDVISEAVQEQLAHQKSEEQAVEMADASLELEEFANQRSQDIAGGIAEEAKHEEEVVPIEDRGAESHAETHEASLDDDDDDDDGLPMIAIRKPKVGSRS